MLNEYIKVRVAAGYVTRDIELRESVIAGISIALGQAAEECTQGPAGTWEEAALQHAAAAELFSMAHSLNVQAKMTLPRE